MSVLFGPEVGRFEGQKLEILKEIPMIKFKDTLYGFKKHSEKEYHKTAVVQSYEYLTYFKGKLNDINFSNVLSKNNEIKNKSKYHNIGIFKELLMFRIDVSEIELR